MNDNAVEEMAGNAAENGAEAVAEEASSLWQNFTILENQFYNNSLLTWTIFVVLAATFFVATRLIVGFMLNRVRSAKEEAKQEEGTEEKAKKPRLSFNWAESLLSRLSFVGYFGVSLLMAAALTPEITEATQTALMRLGLGLLLLQLGLWGSSFLDDVLIRVMKFLHVSEEGAQTAMGVLRFFGFLVLWLMIGMLILVNLNVQITPLLAGMGVGGIALAFALQKILADIFSSVAIVLDRPFEVGDFIIIGGELGTVERIGIKTTRIRSLSGEQIVVSNDDLLNSRVRNFKKMQERRVVFHFGVLYQTPADELEKIGGYVRDIIEGVKDTRFDRAHFFRFGDSSYDFEVVYHVLSRDFNVYMEIQQKINIGIVRKLAEIDVEIAYPTRTLYMEGVAPIKLEQGDGEASRPA